MPCRTGERVAFGHAHAITHLEAMVGINVELVINHARSTDSADSVSGELHRSPARLCIAASVTDGILQSTPRGICFLCRKGVQDV
jgi:hypothetical protein